MSRVGNKPIAIPNGIKIEVVNCSLLISKGDDKVNYTIPKGIDLELKGDCLICSAVEQNKSSSILGLHRSNINNIVLGLCDRYHVALEISGVGYRASIDDKYLTILLGFSHSIKYRINKSFSVSVPKPTEILLIGIDKCYVNMIAADICSLKKFNPYKKKGIYRKGAYMFTKEITKK